MGCESNSRNATPPAPGIAPGAAPIDLAQFASEYEVDPRLPAKAPGFDAPFFQAGLAGYSDSAMRIIARRHGCPYCVTEALLDRTLLAGGRGFAKADLGELHDNIPGSAEDHPLAGQIMGSEPDEMARAAHKLVERNERELGAGRGFQAIDVNLACPVKKIKRKARGGHWLRDPEGAIEILRAVRDATPSYIVASVKMRRSFDDTPEMQVNFEHIFNAAYEMGYDWITVHGRTVEQKYVGPSRWDPIRDLVRRYPDRVIFGSGDIWNASEIFRMLAYTGVQAVSVARGCIGNPWIFRQARDLLAGRSPEPPTVNEQRDVLLSHCELAVLVSGERVGPLRMRKFAVRFAQHHADPEPVRRDFVVARTLDDWKRVLDRHYSADEPAASAL